jgi:glycosyltransferase involved in cell wall biosynthesis
LAERQLKVLMLAPTPYFSDRGCHVRIYEEARAVQALGIDVRIVTYHLGRDMPGIPTYRSANVPWYKKLTAGPSWHKPYLDILLLFKALQLAKTFKPDLIHAHLHEGAFIGLILKKWLAVPLVFDCQGSLTGEIIDHGFTKSGSVVHKGFSFLEKRINNAADFIVTSSGAGAEELVRHWQVSAAKVKAVIDGVDTEVFLPYPKQEGRLALHLPLEAPLVVFLGLLNRYQGLDILLESIALMKARQRQIHFLIMGFPEEQYVEKCRELGLEQMVTFTGRIEYAQAPLYLSAGDIAVSPKISLTEANGKLFNYMACGLPTVVFETPINREILGDSGVYARYADAEDLAARIETLAFDALGRQALAVQVREKAERDHSWRARGEQLVEIYLKAVRSEE